MINVTKNTYTYNLLVLLALTGEYPVSSLYLLGNERTVKARVSLMRKMQTYLNKETGETYTCRAINMTGKAEDRTIHLSKSSLPILEWFGVAEYFRNTYLAVHVKTDEHHIDRQHRVGEGIAMALRSQIKVLPDEIVNIFSEDRTRISGTQISFLKEAKYISKDEQNKTMFTRTTGIMATAEKCIPIYNTRGSAMRWSGLGEIKMRENLRHPSFMHTDSAEIDTAVLFGKKYRMGVDTVMQPDSRRCNNDQHNPNIFRFDRIYPNVLFVPLSEFGVRLLKILSIPYAQERIIRILFPKSSIADYTKTFEYDAYINGAYVFSFLDSNLTKLLRFREAVKENKCKYQIVCYPEQVNFLKNMFGFDVALMQLSTDIIYEKLGGG